MTPHLRQPSTGCPRSSSKPQTSSQLLKSLERAIVSDTESGTLDVDSIEAMCHAQSLRTAARGPLDFLYRSREIRTKHDVFAIAIAIVSDVEGIVGAGYGDTVVRQEQHPLADQTPDRFLGKNGSRLVVWEDEHWQVFNHCVPQILGLATSEEGKTLLFSGKEEHGRAILYKLGVAMFDTDTYWGLLFYGHEAVLFQRVASEDPTRYGLLCSEILPIDSLFLIILGILIVPGNVPMVDTAPFVIPVPTACTRMLEGHPPDDSLIRLTRARNFHLHFSLPDYEPRTIALARLAGSSPFQEPTLHIHERLCIGATGIVYKAAADLVIKAIPPRWKGEDDLRHEALVYESLSALQGSVLPRKAGCFEGEGWLILVIEDCGSVVTDVDTLSIKQRETLWRHACAVHAHGVQHNDLELRNLVVSAVGGVRIIDYAYAELGHKCDEATCDELRDFRRLLCLV
ncbi:hypothetical protein C8R44DRAFT_887486 [Mycena epipterygia]|nr:hypothetical protein C8R44DRAFT_887486 [Mycena epipterygia]